MNHVTVLLHEFMTRFIFPTAYLIFQHHHSWRKQCRKWDLEVQHINCISYWSRFSTSGHVTTFGLLTVELQHCSGMQDQVTWFISTAELSSEYQRYRMISVPPSQSFALQMPDFLGTMTGAVYQQFFFSSRFVLIVADRITSFL